MSLRVSVFTTTYNHEAFIAQAIDSVLAQETDFEFEQVIGEDCSTDGTRDIVLDYQQRYPDRIRVLLRESNIGGRQNFCQTYQACRGQYVAILEGDDYWTSPHKLQKQVDFLEARPDYAFCFHAIAQQRGDAAPEREKAARRLDSSTYTIDDLLQSNFVPTCSVLTRNRLFGDFPAWAYTTPTGDWPFHVLNAQHGLIGYLDEVMAVHRAHPGSVWSLRSTAERYRGVVRTLQIFRQNLDDRYQPGLEDSLAEWQLKLLYALARQGDVRGLWDQAKELLQPGSPKAGLGRAALRAARGAGGERRP